MGITQRFTEHPSSVDESYGEHFRVALHFSRELAGASLQAALHAFFPWMCCSSASSRIKQLNAEMTSGARGARDDDLAAGPVPLAAGGS